MQASGKVAEPCDCGTVSPILTMGVDLGREMNMTGFCWPEVIQYSINNVELTPAQQSALRAFSAELARIFSDSPVKRRSLCVCLPLPPPECDPNVRSNRNAKAAAVKAYRRTCGELAWGDCRTQLGEKPYFRCADILLRYYFVTARPRDPDNLISYAKVAIDSLQDAGILAGDRRVIYAPPVQRKAAAAFGPERPRLEIVITEA